MGRCSFFKLKYVMQCCVYVHLLAVNGSVMLISFPVFFFVHSIAVAVVIVVGSFIQLFCVAKRNLIKLFIIFVCLAFIIVYQLCIPSQSGCNANNKSTREPTKEKKKQRRLLFYGHCTSALVGIRLQRMQRQQQY